MRPITQVQIKSAMERLNRDLEESSRLREVLATLKNGKESKEFEYKVKLRYRGMTYWKVLRQP